MILKNQINIKGLFEQAVENHKKKNLKLAKKLYQEIIQINPNLVNANYNLGLVFQNLGEYEKAKKCYQKVIEINPKLANPHNNLGIVYANLGEFSHAINCYVSALDIDANYKNAKENLILTLTWFNSDKNNPIIFANNSLKKIYKNLDLNEVLKNKNLNVFFKESSQVLSKIQDSIEGINYTETETYRRNSIDLKCKRHHTVFNEKKIIPKFCFGCFKVQIEPNNVFDLIKLFFIFDDYKFSNNNWRKCMIELRSTVKGVYKGLVYCSSLDEAQNILDNISPTLKKYFEYKATIKRGCTEFYEPFPNFKQTDKKEGNFMNYDSKWKEIEDEFEKSENLNKKKAVETLTGLSISDFLVINNWLNYAKLIEDHSYEKVSKDFLYSHYISEKLSSQLGFRKKQLLC